MSDFHDPDRIVGEIFDRLATCRAEMGPASLQRVAAAVRQALGAAVLSEAERRARALAERTGGPRPRDVRVTSWAQRKESEPLDESIEP
ncbi:hypothetical protein PUR21_21755 [Methylorubrum rhodesianum]|uniref:Uncharacterized protein n=1 Tax=Methylorubrum rhodesianum TaxID=29427 RepID=A0ABU9ZFY9_9HYPH